MTKLEESVPPPNPIRNRELTPTNRRQISLERVEARRIHEIEQACEDIALDPCKREDQLIVRD